MYASIARTTPAANAGMVFARAEDVSKQIAIKATSRAQTGSDPWL
jgi:hypothetical protein